MHELDLGIGEPEGRFHPILESNRMNAPPRCASDVGARMFAARSVNPANVSTDDGGEPAGLTHPQEMDTCIRGLAEQAPHCA